MSCEQETRSVSPQCPKPDESEEPIETASANVTSVKLENEFPGPVITHEMEEEEKLLTKEGEEREKKLLEEAAEMFDRDSREMRFKRLQHLLQKSNIYSKFLLTKMEQQQLEEKRMKEKLAKKAKSSQKTEESTSNDKGFKRKRRRDEEYKIADVMSREEIMSKAKKVKEEEKAGPSRKLEVADIEKICESNDDIKDRLSQAIREGGGRELHPDRRVDGQPVPMQQPRLFTGGVMRWYQIEGIEWLRMLWENGINGILADEMGLGKTIQCIAHIAMMIDRKMTGPFLVVAPLSTLPNWISEFKRFTPQVPVQLYHGPLAERLKLLKPIRRPQGPLKICPVVVTSYEIAMIDRQILQGFQWKYLIIDEGHRIKNMNCRLVRELKSLPADNKLLLTGTPLQNNLAELWSLLNYLLPEVFDDLKSFESWFDIDTIRHEAENVLGNEREQKVLNMLHQILTPFLLRRLKSDVALEVPPKKEIIVYAPLVGKQATFYEAAVSKTLSKMLGQEKDESIPVEVSASGRPKRRSRRTVDYSESTQESPYDLEKYLERVAKENEQRPCFPVVDIQGPPDSLVHLKLQNVMMLLKRCCNHPYLVEYPLDPATKDFKIDEGLVQNSGKFLILDRMLPALMERGHKVLIFSQMTSILDLLMDYCYLREYQYSRLDGSMSYTDREENMTRFNTDPDVFLFLLSTRAGGLGINLTAADTVIIFDSDWNPQADLQAQDRCHRIGQTKPVVVYRLATADTIDHAILERATAKRKLEQMVIHKNKFKGGTADVKQHVDLKDLMEMLKGGGTEKQVTGTKSKVISDHDLETLLDRSDLMDKGKKRVAKEKVGVFRVIEATPNITLT